MIKKFLDRVLGSKEGGSRAKPADVVTYEEFEIRPAPVQEGNGWRVQATIVKEVDGDVREHVFVRADSCADHESAVALTVRKARRLIDEQGDKLFR